MIGPDDDFGGGYEEYEPSPYNGDYFEDDGYGDVAADDAEEILDDVEAELAAELDEPGGEDSYLDALMEDRLSGFSGFELGE